MFGKLFVLEFKKYIKQLPIATLLSAILILIIGIACFVVSNTLYAKEPLIQSTVAIVTEEPEDVYLDFILQIMKNNEVAGESLNFEFYDAESAKADLQNGKILAILDFPEHAVEGILNGVNSPISVIYGDKKDITSIILYEVTNTLGNLLSSAQAGTYATSEVYLYEDARNLLGNAFEKVDFLNFGYVLDRERTFTVESVSFGNTSSIGLFYFVSDIVFLLVMLGGSYNHLLCFDHSAFYDYSESRGISKFSYLWIRFLSYGSFLSLILVISYSLLALLSKYNSNFSNTLGQIHFTASHLLLILLIGFFLSAYMIFLSNISASSSLNTMFIFVFGIILLICSGSIIPSAFLPTPLRKIGTLTPTYALHNLLLTMLQSSNVFSKHIAETNMPFTYIITLLVWTIFFIMLTVLLIKSRKK